MRTPVEARPQGQEPDPTAPGRDGKRTEQRGAFPQGQDAEEQRHQLQLEERMAPGTEVHDHGDEQVQRARESLVTFPGSKTARSRGQVRRVAERDERIVFGGRKGQRHHGREREVEERQALGRHGSWAPRRRCTGLVPSTCSAVDGPPPEDRSPSPCVRSAPSARVSHRTSTRWLTVTQTRREWVAVPARRVGPRPPRQS